MGARKIRFTADDADPRRCNRYLIKHTGASDPREGYIVGTKPLMSLGEQLHLMPDEPLACRLLLFVSPVLRKSNEDLVAELILIDHKNRKQDRADYFQIRESERKRNCDLCRRSDLALGAYLFTFSGRWNISSSTSCRTC